nr:MAG TPA: minor tail protein [Bacteriophage sp.]
MADQAAGITLKADVAQIRTANTVLDSFAQKSENTENKVKKLNDTLGKSKKVTGDAAGGMEKLATESQRAADGMTKQERLANRLGMSTKNLGFASRNAAFQLQDIAVTLEMGMPVHRVMLQQLPQLTGAFGGFGNTLRYVAGFLGPVGIGLAAVTATLGVGVAITSRAENQVAALNKTLALSGNISGLTANQILVLSENAERMGGSFRKTRDTIQALTAAGVKAGGDFGALAKVVNDFAKVSSQPIEDVVAAVAKLSTDPVGGLRALADKYHVVNEAQIQQVKSLVDAGRETDAVALANKTAAASFTSMTNEIKANMGTLERSMNVVTSAAKSMWDAILDVGRAQSSNESEMKARESLQRLTTAYYAEMKAVNAAGGVMTEAQKARINMLYSELVAQEKVVASLTLRNRAERDNARAADESAKAKEEANRTARDRAAFEKEYATNAKKRADEIARLNLLNKRGVIDEKELAEAVKQVNERYKDPARAVRVDAGMKMLEVARSELAQLRESGKQIEANASTQTRTQRAQAALNKLIADNEQLIAASKERALTAAEKQQLVGFGRVKEVREQIVEEAKLLDAKEQQVKAHAQIDAFVKNQNAELKATAAGYALSTREAANLREELQLIDRLKRVGANDTDIDKAVSKLREVQEAQTGANASLWDGFSRGLKDSVDEMGNGYTQMASLTKFTFSAMQDTMNEFFETGKLNAKDMVKSILSELIKLATSQAFKSIVGAFGGGGKNGLFGAIFSGLTKNADGGAYAGGNLAAYSGKVVSRPTFFSYGVQAFAKGAGLMGEAGPEAIMPLKRGPDGKLGVAASGAGGGMVVTTNVYTGTGKTDTSVSGPDPRTAQAFGKQITEAVKAEIVKATKPGGVLYKR